MEGGQDQTILRMEADVLFARLSTWIRKHIGDDGSLFARLSAERKKHVLEMFSRFIGSVLVASDLSMQTLERADAIRDLLTKCAFMTELLASNSEAAPSPHTQKFLANFRTNTRALHSLFILVSSKDYVLKLVNEDKIMLLGALPLHIWGEALLSYAETSLRFWKPQCIQCLKLAEDRLTKCLILSPHRHQSSYLLGSVLLQRAKLDTPSSSKALLEKAYRVFYFTAEHLPSFPGYIHALARVAALLNKEGECQQLLKSCIASDPENPLAMLDDADFDRFRGKKWFYELAECAMLADSLASNHVYTDDKQYNRLQNNLLESGFAMKKLIELFSWLPISSGQSQIRAGEESENTRKQKERLQQRLELYQLKPKRDIPGDGNCQMHAVSDQLYNTISKSGEVRKMVVEWLQKNRDLQLPNGAILHQFVHDRKWEDYCAAMAKDGCWGDHLTLLAISEIFGVVISIISSVEGDNYITEIHPTEKKVNKVLLLSHYAEFHYGSLAHIVDTPMCSVE